LLRFLPFLIDNFVPELCLQVLLGNFRIEGTERKIHAKRKHDTNRTTRRTRRLGIQVARTWPDGKRKHCRMVVGTTNEFDDEVAARQAIAGLHLRINAWNERVKVRQITLSELIDHYRQRELKPDILWKAHSTKVTYDGYLNRWIVRDCAKVGELHAQPHQRGRS
jgi:hypothetical protein